MRFQNQAVLAFVAPAMAGYHGLRNEARQTHAVDEEYFAKAALPAPTEAPRPEFGTMELFKRADSICGYLDGDSSLPVSCADSGYICTNSGTIRDCCKSSACATQAFDTVCLDATACPSSPGAGTYCCTFTSTRSACVTYLWSASPGDADAKTFFNCGRSSTLRLLPATPSNASPSDSSTSTTRTSSSTSSKSSSSSSTSTDGGNGGGGGGGGGSSGAPVGAIVGGVVGGVAAIALIALGLFFLLRKRRPADSTPATMAATPAQPPAPSAWGSPPPMQQAGFMPPHHGQSPPNQFQAYAPPPEQSHGGLTPQQQYNPHYSYGGYSAVSTSPGATSNFPAPVGSPVPFANEGAVGNHSPPKQDFKGTPPPMATVAEAPATNARGTGSNYAELE